MAKVSDKRKAKVRQFILLLMGFKLMAGAVASCALIGVAVGVGIIYGSLLISIGRNPSQRDELLRYAFIGFSLVEVSGLIGLVISLLLLFGFDRIESRLPATITLITSRTTIHMVPA